MSLEASLDQLTEGEPRAGEELAEHGFIGPGGLLDALRGDLAVGIWATGGDPAARMPVGGVLAVGTDDPTAMETRLDALFADLPGSARSSCSSDGDCDVHQRPVRWTVLEHDGVAIHVARGADMPLAWAVADDLASSGSPPRTWPRRSTPRVAGSRSPRTRATRTPWRRPGATAGRSPSWTSRASPRRSGRRWGQTPPSSTERRLLGWSRSTWSWRVVGAARAPSTSGSIVRIP